MTRAPWVAGIGFLLFLSGAANASVPARPVALGLNEDDAAINAHLARFRASPAQVMNEPLPRIDEHGSPVDPGADLRFTPEAIDSGSALDARDEQRKRMCMETEDGEVCVDDRAGIGGNDRPERLVDTPQLVSTLEALEQAGLRQGQLSDQPWSDDYWGIYKGMLGARYSDPWFPASQSGNAGLDWRNNRAYVQTYPATALVASGDPVKIDSLSPSEKYELLIGDSTYSLTESFWRTGQGYYDSHGSVETWMGICHGWAPASMMLPRPQWAITLQSADGKVSLRFYPSDIKALASLLWARGSSPVRFLGGRCNVKKPETDANGRVISSQCFDNNPGTWHLAVTHQIGISHRSFLLDANYDYQVWNQPALSYQYRYFNPQTLQAVRTLREASVPMSQFTSDRFRSYRSSQAVSVVGVVMDFTYVAETRPSHRETDAPAQDATRTVRYFYDLELDASGKVIGGEWYTNLHPDFLWVPKPGAHAGSVAENDATGNWDPAGPVPASWRRAAMRAGSRGQVLGKLVEAILDLAAPAR